MESGRFLWLYFISGLMGSLLVVTMQSDLAHPTIGASGAVIGLLAALAVYYHHSKLLVLFFPMKARTAAIGLGALSFFLARRLDWRDSLLSLGPWGDWRTE